MNLAQFHTLLNVVFPPQYRMFEAANPWSDIKFLDDPCCHACGFPFEYSVGPETLCGRCQARRPVYDYARSAFEYNDESRALVLGFKHGGRTEHLSVFAAHMARAGRAFWPNADLIIPVPLHPSRLIRRRFNQATLLGRALARRVDIPFSAHLLKRTRPTPSQGQQTAIGRFRNVQGAFSVTDSGVAALKGKSVVLVDDLFTTGATVEACARVLRKHEVRSINIITLARVVRGQALPK